MVDSKLKLINTGNTGRNNNNKTGKKFDKSSFMSEKRATMVFRPSALTSTFGDLRLHHLTQSRSTASNGIAERSVPNQKPPQSNNNENQFTVGKQKHKSKDRSFRAQSLLAPIIITIREDTNDWYIVV